MTSSAPDSPEPAAVDPEALLRELATTVALLPQAPPAEGETDADPEAMRLPVIEHEGNQYIPVFTSAETLAAAGMDEGAAMQVPLAQLAATLPPGENLGLAVDPASQDGLALPPDVVQALPGLVAGDGQPPVV